MSGHPYTVVVLLKGGSYRQVYRLKTDPHKYTLLRSKALKHGNHYSGHYNTKQVAKIKEKAHRREWEVTIYSHKHYPYLTKNANAHWPTDRRLLSALNEVGRDLSRRIHIVSGKRTQAECVTVWNRYMAGGPVAARPWACGGHCCSNHFTGHAADCGVIGSDGKYRSIGLHPGALKVLRKHHIGLPVPSEAWHAEYGAPMRWLGAR